MLLGIIVANAQNLETATEEIRPPASALLFPDFAQPGDGKEDIKAPEPLTDKEKLVMQSAAEMSSEDLSDLLQVYERMGNVAMQQALSLLLLERVPEHPIARRLLQGVDGSAQVRKPDYLDEKAAEVLSGKAASDPEAVAAQARALLASRQSEQAIALLDALRRTTFPSQRFPFLEDLGYAYSERQQWDEAATAFADVLAQEDLPPETQKRVSQQMEVVRMERRIAKIRNRTYADPAAALRESESLIAEQPHHPSVIIFRVECLQYAGKTAEALALLKQLKDASANAPAFAYQRHLGYTHQQLKQWDDARAIFEELHENPVFSREAREDASKAIISSSISKVGEEALSAAGFGDWEKASSMISELEQQHPGNLEVFSYRCSLLARSGQGEEALRRLTEKRAALAPSGKPFPLQDTVGDVYVALKRFDEARAAYQAILDEPRYDWAMRRRALDAPALIRRVELLEQGFLALRDRRIEHAKSAAAALHEEFGPDARELKLLRAEILLAQNHPARAATALEQLKEKTPATGPFEATSSLAAAYLRTGRAEEALQAYKDILDHHRAYTPFENMQAHWEVRSALPLQKANASALASHRSEQDGSATRADITYSSPWWGAWRAQVFSHGDFIHLKSTLSGIAHPSVDERLEAGARLQRRINESFAIETHIGSSQNDVLYGARIGNFLYPGLNWSAGFSGNARSTESIALEALDARENRFDLAFGGPLAGPWNLDIHASANWVRVGRTNVGRGIGGSLALEYLVQTETEKRPEIAVGYMGEYRRFTPADIASPLSSLLDTETHRHGITAAYRRNLDEDWRLQANVGAFYALDESTLQYTAGLTLQHYFSDDFMAYLDLRYDSNSRSLGEDGGAFEATAGLSKTF
jgi:predicted Zn-dependent protease